MKKKEKENIKKRKNSKSKDIPVESVKNDKKENIFKFVIVGVVVVLCVSLLFLTIPNSDDDLNEDEIVDEIVDEIEEKETIKSYINCSDISSTSVINESDEFKEASEILKSIGLDKYISSNGSSFFEFYNEKFKSIVALSNVPSDYVITGMTCDTLYSDSYLWSGEEKRYGIPLEDEMFLGFCKNEADVVLYDVANMVYRKMYGVDMPKEDLFFYSSIYDYNEESDKFIKLDSRCDPLHLDVRPPIYVIKSVENTTYYNGNDKLKVEIYFIEFVVETDENNPYKYDMYFNGIMLDSRGTSSISEELKEKGLLKYAPVYEFGFVKKDGTYVFDYVEKK